MLNILGVPYFWDTLYRHMKHTLAMSKHLNQSNQKTYVQPVLPMPLLLGTLTKNMGLLDEMWDQFCNFL